MSVIDQYLMTIDIQKRKELERIRAIAKEVIPEADEVISYGMPTLKYKGKAFLGFSIRSNHIGIYPYGMEEIELFTNKLEELNYGFSSGAIRIPFDKPVPEDLLKEIIRHRVARINNT